jgi:hypothetical protein
MLPDRKYLNYNFKNVNVNGDNCFDTQEKSVIPGGVKNGKFVTLTPFEKNRPESMKPPQTNAKKFCF